MLRLRLRITQVDMNGFLGRDRHPSPEMRGEVVEVVAMETELFTVCENESYPVQLFTCRRENGDLVELIDHEVAFYDSSRRDS